MCGAGCSTRTRLCTQEDSKVDVLGAASAPPALMPTDRLHWGANRKAELAKRLQREVKTHTCTSSLMAKKNIIIKHQDGHAGQRCRAFSASWVAESKTASSKSLKTARIAFYARERVYNCCCFDSAMVTIVVTVEVITEEKLNFLNLQQRVVLFRSRC